MAQGPTGASAGGRINRTILVYREENFARVVKEFETTLGCDLGDVIENTEDGLREVVSWDHGLEIISPISGEGRFGPAIAEYLHTHGEGFFGFTYEVDDLDAAEARAKAAGHERIGDHVDCLLVEPAWTQRFRSAVEAVLTPIAGIGVTLIKLDRREQP